MTFLLILSILKTINIIEQWQIIILTKSFSILSIFQPKLSILDMRIQQIIKMDHRSSTLKACFQNMMKTLSTFKKKIKSTSFELIFKNPLKSSLPPISRSKLLNLFLEIGKKGDKKPKLANFITINKNNLDVLKAIFGDNDFKLNVGESLNFNDSLIDEKLNHDYEDYLSKNWEPWSQKNEQRNLYLKFYKSLVNLNRDLDSNLSDDKRINDLSLGIGMLSLPNPDKHINIQFLPPRLILLLTRKTTMRLFLLQGYA